MKSFKKLKMFLKFRKAISSISINSNTFFTHFSLPNGKIVELKENVRPLIILGLIAEL